MTRILLFAFFILSTLPAMTQAKKYAVTKTDAEWRKQLNDEQFQVTRKKEPNELFPESTGTITKKAFTNASAADRNCSIHPPNLRAEPAGQVFGNP